MKSQKNVSMLEAALGYQRQGFSIIPIRPGDKKPLIEWAIYQKQPATADEIREWWLKWPDANIGLVTGAVSGVVVIDIDKGGSTKGFSPTVISRTGGGGFHLFYKHPNVPVKNSVKDLAPFTDVRGDGGYAVLPPSLHMSGNRYEWSLSPEDSGFATLPERVFERIRDTFPVKTDWVQFPEKPVLEGERNNAAAKYAGKLLYELSPELWESAGWGSLKDWNKTNCTPPLEEKELRAVFESIANREKSSVDKGDEEAKQTQTIQLIEFVIGNPDIMLFHDEQGDAYVRLPIDSHFEIWPCESSHFKRWLSKSFYESTKKVPGQNVLVGALQIIQAKADFDGEELPLATRTALRGEEVWYDLANRDWESVRVTPEGWQIENDISPTFRRYGYQAPQVTPLAGGDLRDLLRFVNIKNPDHQMLFLVGLCCYFIPGSPRPIFYFYGPQGSAKTTASKILRKLIDPSRVEILALPKNTEELKQMLAHYHFLSFDNVSRIYDDAVDLLCQAVTGSGFSKRKLYTDDDDIIRIVQANISINGINIATNKPDFLERCVLVELERVDKLERRQEHELMDEFKNMQPQLLGAIFSAVARSLVIRRTITLNTLPRMADFALWGAAIAEAIGFSKEDFLAAYSRNINTQNEEVLSDNPVAALIVVLMEDHGEWSGSASTLLKELNLLAEGENINPKDLPKGAQALSRELTRLKTSLAEIGLLISKSAGAKRTVTISKMPATIVDTVIASADETQHEAVNDDGDGIDDEFGSLPDTNAKWSSEE